MFLSTPQWCNRNKKSVDADAASVVINLLKQSKFRAEKADLPSANIDKHYQQPRLVNQTKCLVPAVVVQLLLLSPLI